jgi:hypothetical protein
MGVHGHFGVHMLSHERGRLFAERTVAQCSALGTAGYDSDMFCHISLQGPTYFSPAGLERQRNTCQVQKLVIFFAFYFCIPERRKT